MSDGPEAFHPAKSRTIMTGIMWSDDGVLPKSHFSCPPLVPAFMPSSCWIRADTEVYGKLAAHRYSTSRPRTCLENLYSTKYSGSTKEIPRYGCLIDISLWRGYLAHGSIIDRLSLRLNGGGGKRVTVCGLHNDTTFVIDRDHRVICSIGCQECIPFGSQPKTSVYARPLMLSGP